MMSVRGDGTGHEVGGRVVEIEAVLLGADPDAPLRVGAHAAHAVARKLEEAVVAREIFKHESLAANVVDAAIHRSHPDILVAVDADGVDGIVGDAVGAARGVVEVRELMGGEVVDPEALGSAEAELIIHYGRRAHEHLLAEGYIYRCERLFGNIHAEHFAIVENDHELLAVVDKLRY